MLRPRRLLPALLGVVSLTGAACGLAPAAQATDGPQIVAYDVPSTVQVDVPATFDATLTDDASTLGSISWSFGDGSAPTSGAQTSHAWGWPGTYTVTVSATDALGIQASQSFLVDVEPVPATTTDSAPPPAAPALTFAATQSRERWTPRHGTRFTLSLSQRANVTITFAKRGKGDTNPSGQPVGTLSTNVAAGRHRLGFQGLIGAHHTLAPGNYVATFTASAGAASAAPVKLSFTVQRTEHEPNNSGRSTHARRLRQRDRRR